MKKRLISLLLCVCLMVGMMQGTTSAIVNIATRMPNGEPIFFTVVNDVLQELKYSMIPIEKDGIYYIPYTILTNNFNIRSSYSASDKILYLSNMRDNIKFDINAGCAYDKNGKIDAAAILTKGQVFVPLHFICEYLGLTYAFISTGPIIRIRDENYFYPNQFLSVLFENRMQEMLTEFLESQNKPPEVDPPVVDPPPPVEKDPATVYLTFDDGPSEHTAGIVDALTDAGYTAAFFMVGNRIADYESEVRKAYIMGNQIALHSYSHNKASFYASTDAMLKEFADSNALIRRVLQTETRLVRIPFGSSEPEFTEEYREALKGAGYRYWDWTIHANDIGENVTAKTVLNNIISQLEESERDTEVILMHESAATAEMLPELLDYLTENKFKVQTISPLIDPINARNEK